MRFEKMVKLYGHFASKRSPRMVIGTICVQDMTTGTVDHVGIESVGKEPCLKKC
jgi:hypothetical protein